MYVNTSTRVCLSICPVVFVKLCVCVLMHVCDYLYGCVCVCCHRSQRVCTCQVTVSSGLSPPFLPQSSGQNIDHALLGHMEDPQITEPTGSDITFFINQPDSAQVIMLNPSELFSLSLGFRLYLNVLC